MDLRNKYFHGVQSYMHVSDIRKDREKQLEEILYKFESILKSGYILAYKDIEKLHGKINRNPLARMNGDDRISISLHEKNPELIDYKYLKNHYREEIENAFKMFIFENVAIVLNESIKDNYNIIEEGIYLERQVDEPISLKYMDAVSILPTYGIEYLFDSEEDTVKLGQIHTGYYFDLNFIKRLEELLHKYGYNVPIVSIRTGHVFNENNEYYEKVTYSWQKKGR